MRARLWMMMGILTILCAGLSGCAAAGKLAQPTASAPQPTPTPAAQKTSPPLASAADKEKLSSRLQILLENPALASASPSEQSKAFSLPPSGAGSIRFDKQGRVLVNIRVKDVSDATIQSLKDSGVVVLSVSKEFMVVAGYVSPPNLAAVSNLASVLSLEEELAPEMRSGGG